MSWSVEQTGNPSFVWVRALLNGVDITELGRWHFMSMSFERSQSNVGGKVSLELFDPEWTEIENLLFHNRPVNQPPVLHLQYGYADGRLSPVIRMQITGVGHRMEPHGVTLSITGTNDAYAIATTQWVKSYSGKSIAQIVDEVARAEGLDIGYIEPTLMIPHAGAPSEHMPFARGPMSTMQFLNYLTQFAVSEVSGRGGYIVQIVPPDDPESESKGVLYFSPPKGVGTADREYTFYRDQMGEVISFEPQISNLLEVFGGHGGKLAAVSIDPISKEVSGNGYDPMENPREAPEGGDKTNYQEAIDTQGTGRYLLLPGMSPTAIRLRQIAMSDLRRNGIFAATLTVVGDPTISVNPMGRVRVNCFTNRGALHYASGIYLIRGVTDQIQGGDYTTTMELFRESAGAGMSSVDAQDDRPRAQ